MRIPRGNRRPLTGTQSPTRALPLVDGENADLSRFRHRKRWSWDKGIKAVAAVPSRIRLGHQMENRFFCSRWPYSNAFRTSELTHFVQPSEHLISLVHRVHLPFAGHNN